MRALLVAAAALLVAAPAAHAADNGSIAFMSNRDGPAGNSNFEIYTINPDGTDPKRLTTDPALDGQPSWSPDGLSIAFTSQRTGGSDIYVMNADGTDQRRLTTGADKETDPAWSPDGQHILYVDSAGPTSPNNLFVMGADGSNQTLVTTGANPAWSADSARIAFTDPVQEGIFANGDVFTAKADGTNRQRLTSDPSFDFEPTWAPDGTRILFTTLRQTFHRVFTMGDNGSNQVPFTNENTDTQGSDFAPDGTKVVYSSDLDIEVADATGGPGIKISHPGTQPDWGPAPDPDSDGDALPDKWETDGVDVDGDGTVDLDLPAMGADPDHKDVFVEIDAMAGHELEQSGVDMVVQAFRDAPVGNPDLVDGIALHVDNGPGSVMDPKTGETWGLLSQHETLPHLNVLGNNVGGPYDWTAFDALKTVHFSLDRGPVFHYVISAHRYGDAAEASSGISRGIGAGDLIVSLGPCQPPGGADCTFTALDQAGTFMHELGHNLGLKHGGTDGANNKANYLSIMNYDFQFTGLAKVDGTSVLDYSRFKLASLDENALDENLGLGAAPGSAGAGFNTIITCGATKVPIPVRRRAVDFDCNGVNDGVIATDINDDNHQTVLAGAEDWSRLVYDGGGAIGSLGAPTPPATTPLIEPPVSELLAAQAAVQAGVAAPPPTPATVAPPVVTPPFAAPTTTGIAPAPPTPRPVTCSLKASSSVALHGHTRNQLTVTARCSAAATVHLRGTVTTTVAARHGKRRHIATTLRTVTVHTRAGRNQTIAIVLPATVVRAVTRHQPTSARLRLDGAGVRTATANISRLRGRR